MNEALITPPPAQVDLLPWDESGLALLRAMSTPDQKLHLGGPETEAKLLDRHARYLTYHRPGDVEMLRIGVDGEVVGSVGYWEHEEAGEPAYEIGWEIRTAFHGRGIGSRAAALLLTRLQPVALHRFVYAYPTPDNAGSNGVCRKLGFDLTGVGEFEYPRGVFSPHNIWRLDLPGWSPPSA